MKFGIGFFLLALVCIFCPPAFSQPAIATTSLPLSGESLHDLAGAGRLSEVKAILEKKPELLESRDSDGWAPLAYAARYGREEMVEYLLSRKANVGAVDNHQFTALHRAAAYGHTGTIELLLKAGAQVNARSEGSVTPRRLATSNGHRSAARLLRDRGGMN